MSGEGKPCFSHCFKTWIKHFISSKVSFPSTPPDSALSMPVQSALTMTASQTQPLPALRWRDRQPCQLPPPTEDGRTKETEGGRQGMKGTKNKKPLTFFLWVWLKSCLPSRVSWSNLLTNENVFLSFFSDKGLHVPPFECFDQFLVIVDGLKSGCKNDNVLPFPHFLFGSLFLFDITSAPHFCSHSSFSFCVCLFFHLVSSCLSSFVTATLGRFLQFMLRSKKSQVYSREYR